MKLENLQKIYKKEYKKSGIHFNLARKKERIMDFDIQMSDPTFWNDQDRAKTISQEATLLKTEVEGHEALGIAHPCAYR